MKKTRPWLLGWGNLLTLIGLVGFCALHISDGLGTILLWIMPRTVALDIVLNWYWFMAVGLLLTYLGKGREPLGHWYQLIDGLSAEPSVLYEAVTEQLRARDIPNSSISRPSLRQRSPLGGRRVHLRVKSGYFQFDFCAHPYGRDFGLSWRCYASTGLLEQALLSLPVIKWVFYWLIYPYTTYMEDRGLLFQTAVQRCVGAAVNEMVQQKGLRALDDADLKPIMADMLKRWG